MEIKIYNKDNLNDSDIDIVVTRVKVYLINSKNELIIAYSNGGIQLPGGHVEDGEDLESACIREVKEETGIILEDDLIPEPFFEIKHYTKNYKDQGINRVARIIYYVIKTNKVYAEENTKLTENEKQNNFKILSIPYKDFEKELVLIKDTNTKEINRVIAEEILESFSFLKKKWKYIK